MDGLFPRSGVMQGKTFDTANPEHAAIWDQVLDGLRHETTAELRPQYMAPRFGRPFLTSARLGQGGFRALVADAYQRRCAITGESTLPVLEAAHIHAYKAGGPHAVFNGLLLRADFHKLFDLNLVTVAPDHTIMVSKRIRDQWFNGKNYYRLDGQPLAVLPEHPDDRPNLESLRWHNQRFPA
jgi:putative restriction endonuclease